MTLEGTPTERPEVPVETSPPVADLPTEQSGTDVESGPTRRDYADWLTTAVEADDANRVGDAEPGTDAALPRDEIPDAASVEDDRRDSSHAADQFAGDPGGSDPSAETSQTGKDLYAFGGKRDDGYPRPPRPGDFEVESPDDHIGPYRPETPGDVVPGASSYTSVEAGQVEGLTGQVFRLPAGTELPSGVGVHADGEDVGGQRPEGHRTTYPTERMSLADFQDRYQDLSWEWHGTINKRGAFNPAEGR